MKISENIYIDWHGFDGVVSTETRELSKIVRCINRARDLNSTVSTKLWLVDTLLSVINHKLIIAIKEFPQTIKFVVQPCQDNFGVLKIKNDFFFDLDEEEIDTFSNHYDIKIADKCITNLYCIFKKFYEIPFYDAFYNMFDDLYVINTVTKRRFDVWARIGSIILGEPVEKLETVSDRFIRDAIFRRVFGDKELKHLLTKQLLNSNFGTAQLIDTDTDIVKEMKTQMRTYLDESVTEYLNTINGRLDKALGIVDVKFNDPATIVFWDDGTKTVVKCQEGDTFDPEKGLAMAIIKKRFADNHGYFNRIFKKWCPEPEEDKPLDNLIDSLKNLSSALKAIPEDSVEDNVETKEFTKANDGYDDITWLTRRNYDRA